MPVAPVVLDGDLAAVDADGAGQPVGRQAAAGVDGVFSDYPDRVLTALGRANA